MEVSTTTQATVSVSEVATGADGAAAPALAKAIAGVDGGGNLQDILVDTGGRLQVDATVPATVATTAKQDTGNTSLGSIDTKLTSQATAAKQDTGNTSLGSIDTKLTSQATAAKQDTGNTSVASIDTKTPTVGQKAMAASSPVVLASDQSAIPVTMAAVPTGGATAANQNPATITGGALYVDLSTINGSGGLAVTVAAAVAAAIKVLSFTNVSGNNIGVYDGATLVGVIGAGADNQIGVAIAAGHDVKLRMMGAAAGASGDILCLNLMG